MLNQNLPTAKDEQERLQRIRNAEKNSHVETYSSTLLFEKGSWLEKPVRAVTDLFPYLDMFSGLRVLDLGSGIGRNCIPVAQRYHDCRIECVDILDFSMEKLREYSEAYGVSGNIEGIVMPLERFTICKEAYHLIMAISALEHVDGKQSFVDKLYEIRDGVKNDGFVCLVINSEVTEVSRENGKELEPQFEVNLSAEELKGLLVNIFEDWEILKFRMTEQQYDIPRGDGIAHLNTHVITLTARKRKTEVAHVSDKIPFS